MDIVFISGVELGHYALNGLVDSVSFRQNACALKAIFGLSSEKAALTSGFQAFDAVAGQFGIPFHEISTLKSKASINLIRQYAPDLICIIGWSELAPSELLDVPKEKHNSLHRHARTHGCIGIHPTLLPRGRGRAPIPWSIIKGLTKSGVTLFYLEEGADTGDIIAQRDFTIELRDDAASVYAKVANLHYELMKDILPKLVAGRAERVAQDPSKATVWQKRQPKDGLIDWNKTKMAQYNWIRALTRPYPGAFCYFKGQKLSVWRASMDETCKPAVQVGTIVDIRKNGIVISCIDGCLILEELQLEGEASMPGMSFAGRHGLSIGQKL
jgi:methionyl-tRNA formyltransferase